MEEIHREPERAFGNEHEPMVSCTVLPALLHHSRPACVLGRGQGSQHTPGHAVDLKVLGCDTASLSLPVQIRLMLQHKAISCRFPGTFHMVPLLHYLLAYTQGLFCPLKCSHLPTQRPLYIYSPPSYAAFDGRNH